MGLACTTAVALVGVRGQVVEIQADVSGGVPYLAFTGLASKAVREAEDRIHAAMTNSHVPWPAKRMTLALLPADVRKDGSLFDLALAMALLAAAEEVPTAPLDGTVWVAELGLDGGLRPVRGVLPAIAAAKAAGITRAVVAPENGAEAALVPGVDVRVPVNLRAVIDWLRGEAEPPARATVSGDAEAVSYPDLVDVAGQTVAKRGLEVAAAGNHNLFMKGTPRVRPAVH